MKMNANRQTATLAGESFYVMEPCFRAIPGIITVKPGHCVLGGINIEVVQITFDANKVGFPELINCHFKVHNPTAPTKDDAPIQSIIFTHDAQQAQQAKAQIALYQKSNPVNLRTKIVDFGGIVADPAAANYYTNNFNSEKSTNEIKPKLDKFNVHLASVGMQNSGLNKI